MGTDEVVRSLVRDLRPVRRLRGAGWRTLAWASFALACVSIGAWALGARSDLPVKMRDPEYVREGALLLLAFALSARSAFLFSVPGAEGGAALRALPIAALLAWACLVSAGPPSGTLAAASWTSGSLCVLKMTCLALLPALAVVFMLRKGAPLSAGWTGWFALSSAFSLALLGTRILCARDDPGHLFLWHLGPLLAIGLAGIHLGRWVFRRPAPARSAPAPR